MREPSRCVTTTANTLPWQVSRQRLLAERAMSFTGLQAQRPAGGRIRVYDQLFVTLGIDDQGGCGNRIKRLPEQMFIQFFQYVK